MGRQFDLGAFGIGLFCGMTGLTLLLLWFDRIDFDLLASDGVFGAFGGAIIGSFSAYWTMRRGIEIADRRKEISSAEAVQVKLVMALSHLEAIKRGILKGKEEAETDPSARISVSMSGLKPAGSPIEFSAEDSSALMLFLSGEDKVKALDFVGNYAAMYDLFLNFLARRGDFLKKHGIPSMLVGSGRRTVSIQDSNTFYAEADLFDEEALAIFSSVDRLLSGGRSIVLSIVKNSHDKGINLGLFSIREE